MTRVKSFPVTEVARDNDDALVYYGDSPSNLSLVPIEFVEQAYSKRAGDTFDYETTGTVIRVLSWCGYTQRKNDWIAMLHRDERWRFAMDSSTAYTHTQSEMQEYVDEWEVIYDPNE